MGRLTLPVNWRRLAAFLLSLGGWISGLAAGPATGPYFPRLAMWWPDTARQSAADLARYDWIGFGPWDSPESLRAIKTHNPGQIQLMSINATETVQADFADPRLRSVMLQIPAAWFLVQEGSRLRIPVDKHSPLLLVERTRNGKGIDLFAPGDTLVLGQESVRVLEVDHGTRRLRVQRGFVRPARAHKQGVALAAHVSFWPGTWVMNLASTCPKADCGQGPETWGQWAARVYLPLAFGKGPDGLLVDRLEESQSWLVGQYCRSLDPTQDGRGMADPAAFDREWAAGIRDLLAALRPSVGKGYLIANSFGAFIEHLDGSIWEGLPTNWSDREPVDWEDWARGDGAGVLGPRGYVPISALPGARLCLAETYAFNEWYDGTARPRPWEVPGWQPDLQRMRFGLTTALLGNGWFSFETSTEGHGSLGLHWFDEYDNAGRGRGYLGQALGPAHVVLDLGAHGQIFRRDFAGGIVLCNPTGREISLVLNGRFRAIAGKQDPGINHGGVVERLVLPARDGRILLRSAP